MWSDDLTCRDSPLSDAPGALANSYLATGYLRVYSITVYNSAASAQWVLMFDASSLPADTAVPRMAFPIAAAQTLGLYYGPMGRIFKRGLILCNSSTDTTKTIGSANCFYDVEYDHLDGVYLDPDAQGGQ